ncbi:MAG: DPP IV N-terminal domain-containing protein, partial [Bacteroidota bacterium]|nr:DPP IV N-terminal domain-containing protein [Bacteroidota bacterium]
MKKLSFAALCVAVSIGAYAQQGRVLTAKDYERAESFMSYNTQPLVDHGDVRPNWLPGDKFWYRTLTPTGSEFVLVDPVKKTRTAAFNQEKLAAALSAASGKQYNASMLPFQGIGFTDDDKYVTFQADGKKWKYGRGDNQLSEDNSAAQSIEGRQARPGGRRGGGNEVLSPDGQKSAFIKDYNLWVRDVKTRKETQLTTDGIKNFGYATDNAGWTMSDRAILLWSPDSKKIATFKQDERNVSNMYLVTTNVGKPTLK